MAVCSEHGLGVRLLVLYLSPALPPGANTQVSSQSGIPVLAHIQKTLAVSRFLTLLQINICRRISLCQAPVLPAEPVSQSPRGAGSELSLGGHSCNPPGVTGCASLPGPRSPSLSSLEIFTSCLLLVFQQLLRPLKVPEAFSVNHFGGGPGSAHRPRGAPGSGCPRGSFWGPSGACSSSSHSNGPHCRAHPAAVPTGSGWAGLLVL